MSKKIEIFIAAAAAAVVEVVIEEEDRSHDEEMSAQESITFYGLGSHLALSPKSPKIHIIYTNSITHIDKPLSKMMNMQSPN